ncbi:hypothetical protein NS365_04655 [Aureimonas ureilytica]|uniref:Uncharacterized protein n=2 Tax=Aureimonas ureilytica TaxID=401562 RepID=A0A175RWT7_9HYPH|nr:hypothetical protein NS365_04655 [Aureimonas ureilytica]
MESLPVFNNTGAAMTDHIAPDLKALKSTGHALVEAVGGCVAAKVILGHKSPSTISAQTSISEPDRWMNVRDLMVLERHAQRPIVSEWLVERHKADPDRVRRPLSIEDVARLAKESAEAKLAILAALADGKVDQLDRTTVAREMRELIAVASEVLDAVEFGA